MIASLRSASQAMQGFLPQAQGPLFNLKPEAGLPNASRFQIPLLPKHILDFKGNEHTVGSVSLPSWKQAAFNFDQLLHRGETPLAFTKKLEAEGSVCAFRWNPEPTNFAWSYCSGSFPKQTDFSASSARAALAVRIPAALNSE